MGRLEIDLFYFRVYEWGDGNRLVFKYNKLRKFLFLGIKSYIKSFFLF